MRFSLVPLALMLTAAAQSDQVEDGTLRCGTEPANATVASDRFPAEQLERRARRPINIDVYMHFVAPDDTYPERTLRRAAQRQLDVLNDAFRPSGISFTMPDVLFWVDPAYSTLRIGSNLVSLIQKYRRGGVDTLNLFVPMSQGGALGSGACVSFDDVFTRRSVDQTADGCSVSSMTLPGSISARYNEGKTAVHEVGHWLGLLHTFDGGCDGPGDHISDTPAQAYATFTCDEGQDTCPSQPGLDPIHNYMGYSPDSCMTEFTRHQSQIMHYSWNNFRK